MMNIIKLELTILLLLLISTCRLFAQYESVFGDNNTSWILLHELNDAFISDSVYVMGDTIIDEKFYRNVGNPRLAEFWFLRESVNNQQVFFLCPERADSEFLAMDLNLEYADTFQLGVNNDLEFIVDSVYFLNNRKQIRFRNKLRVIGVEECLIFIEGVGSNFGLFYQGLSLEEISNSNYLLCSYKDNMLMHSNQSLNGVCNVFWTGKVDEIKTVDFAIYPNPVKDYINIDINNGNTALYQFKIYSIHGSLLKSITSLSLENNKIFVGDLPSGIYVLVIGTNNIIERGKLIINK